MSEKKPFTADDMRACAGQAYKDLGYPMVRFRDGSFGVLKCPAKTITLMNRFQTLLEDKLVERGVLPPIVEEKKG